MATETVIHASALRLLPPSKPAGPVCADTVELLLGLLAGARTGNVTGVAVSATLRQDHGYFVDVSGDFLRDPTLARGALLSLDDELRLLVRGERQ